MKKRNTTIFAFLLLAAVGMGVGYAALTDNLGINGNATVENTQAQLDWNNDVKFTNMSFTQDTRNDAAVAAVSYADQDDKATLTITGLDSIGDKITVTLTVSNANENYNAAITLDTGSLTKNDGNFNVKIVAPSVVTKGGSAEFTVEIELLVQPTEQLTTSFDVSFVATAVNP